MSLSVCLFRLGPDGAAELVEGEHSFLPFGPERWRHSVWGSAPVRALGLSLLPSLATGDIYAHGPDLDQLEVEQERAVGRNELAGSVGPEAQGGGDHQAAVAAARTGVGRVLRPRPDGRSGCVPIRTTSCVEASNASREATANRRLYRETAARAFCICLFPAPIKTA